jgi:hypothetical protein
MKIMKKAIICLLAASTFALAAQAQTGNVGIGTNTPTNKLHVNGTDPLRLQGVQLSTSGTDKGLVLDANGVVKTKISDQSYFVGYLSSDFSVPFSGTILKMIVQTVQLDASNEYNATTGLFTPLTSGLYEYEITATLVAVTAPTTYADMATGNYNILGFVNAATNSWVGRFNVQSPQTTRAYFVKGVASLTAGTSYFFGISANANNTIVTANPTGSTGTGIGTYFSVRRIQ